MDIIDRYIYSVTSKLPEKEREEVEAEIKGLVDDMINSDESDLPYEQKVDKVLRELGNPEVLADNYRGEKRYLIGPKYFHRYIYVLKIVLFAVFLGMTVASIVGLFFNDSKTLVVIITEYLSSLIGGVVQAAVWVTVIFAIIQYKGIDMDKKKNAEKEWTPSDLPHIPNSKAMIKLSESIVGIIFITLFFIIIYFVPDYFGAYITTGQGNTVIPIFNVDKLSNFRFILISLFIVGISKELAKFILGRWTIKLALIYSLLSVISSALVIVFILTPGIWNAEFIKQVFNIFNNNGDIMAQWNDLLHRAALVVVAITALEVGIAFFKGIKYGNLK